MGIYSFFVVVKHQTICLLDLTGNRWEILEKYSKTQKAGKEIFMAKICIANYVILCRANLAQYNKVRRRIRSSMAM